MAYSNCVTKITFFGDLDRGVFGLPTQVTTIDYTEDGSAADQGFVLTPGPEENEIAKVSYLSMFSFLLAQNRDAVLSNLFAFTKAARIICVDVCAHGCSYR